jgi:hypothetical protein
MLRRFEDVSAGRYQTTTSEEALFTELDKVRGSKTGFGFWVTYRSSVFRV